MKINDRALSRLLAGVALGAGLVASAAAPVAAREAGPNHQKMFERMDADHSGGVTLDEMRAGMLARFDQADADGDGKVSRAEFDAAALKMREAHGGDERHGEHKGGHDGERHGKGPDGPPDGKRAHGDGPDHGRMAARLMGRADADEDGGLSPAEYAALGERMKSHRPDMTPPEFATLDANGDGMVDEPELGMGLAAAMEGRPDRPDRPHGDRRGDEDRGGRFFGMLDKDGDGAVTREEFAASPMMDRMGAMLARLDVDGDGAVSLEEAKAMRGHQGGPDHGPGFRHGPPPADGDDDAPKLDAKP